MRWHFPEPADTELCEGLARAMGLPPFLAELLCRRGFPSAAEADAYLDPRLKALSDPFLLPGMAAAIDRLLAAVDRQERIVLYGDYDVDGISSLALLTRVLRAYGAEPRCFLPLRMDEGYGLTREGITRCLGEHQPQLLVAVDCGTSSKDEALELRRLGVDLVILDHHEAPGGLPECVAVVNPKASKIHPYLCSAGLVFKTAHALLKRRPLSGFDLREYLDFVALATVADLVPLVGENRILTRRGLEQIGKTRWPGLRALAEVAAVGTPVTAGDVGFKLGPRMNAAGRLGTAQTALDLLLAEDEATARPLARELDLQNRDRRAVEEGVLLAAEAQLLEVFAPERDAAIVVGAEGWHPGVVGIVASRLMRRQHRPAIVVAFDESGLGKGSGRSIAGLPLVEALAECGGHLERSGGHEMAAGLTIRAERFAEFRAAFLECARRRLTAEQLIPRLHLDGEMSLAEVSLPFLDHHDRLQPFGMGNGQPVFIARSVLLSAEPRVMKEKHLSFTFRQGRASARAVWFGGAAEKLPRLPWDIAFTLERNTYQGTTSAQMQVKAVRTAE